MPLSPTGPDLSFLDDPPSENEELASAWATAIGDYASDIVSAPEVVEGTAELATAALEASLIGTLPLGLTPPYAANVFDAPMVTFGTAIAAGMAPAFVGTPPALPFSTTVFPSGVLYPDTESAKSGIGALIYAWFNSGTATSVAGVGPTPWS